MTDTTTLERTTPSATTILDHWVDGSAWAGESSRTAPVFNPALGTVQKEVRLASTADVAAAVDSASAAWLGWRDASIAKRQTVMFAFRELLNARKGELAADPHLGARQGARRRARRDRPRHGGRRVRVRPRAPDEGRLLRERLDRHRRLHDAPAARRRRHHQPVQLPGDGAAVVLLDRARRRQRRDPEALARRTRAPRTGWRRCSRRPACPTACSTSCTATRRRSTRCSSTPTCARSRSSARPRSPGTSTRPRPVTASACRPSAARRTTC